MILFLYLLSYYMLAGLAINVGYHRCLAHRAFRLPKGLERMFVTLGLPAGTPIQWAGTHRFHHRFADRELDPHSPNRRGFWHAHVGWYIGTANPWICSAYALAGPLRTFYDAWHRPRSNQEYNWLAPDVSADPYYRFVSRPVPFFVACLLHQVLLLTPAVLLWGGTGLAAMSMSAVLIYNIGDAIDSVAHLVGTKIGYGPDMARNHWILGILALGEGWHANHHACPRNARHGRGRYQFDWTWQVIKGLSKAGLATKVVLIESAEPEALSPTMRPSAAT